MIVEWLRIQKRYLMAYKEALFQRKKITSSKKKHVFVMLAANYDNLGDIAITKAQSEFLRNCFSDEYDIIVVPFGDTYKVYYAMKRMMNRDSVITLIGGGNSGTLYEFIEAPRRFILKNFRHYKIISFPQSVFYGDSEANKVYMREFTKLCKRCNDLVLIARENQSYNIYKSILSDTPILLLPDIVFSMNSGCSSDTIRNGALIIFRSDSERGDCEDQKKEILEEISQKYNRVDFRDTIEVDVQKDLNQQLDLFLESLCSYEVVITDRLHGMIMSYITHTPCVVFDNSYHKVRSVYETWLDGSDNVKMILKNKDKYLDETKTKPSVEKLSICFDGLREILR